MGARQETGRVTTFYSFKGGVGRTMALANVGFLAAMAGRRTLLMDFDLEAPGLTYYFRGLSTPAEARFIKTAPGLLNLAWNWHSRVAAAGGEQDLSRLFEEHEVGRPFADCTRELVPKARLPEGACLHVIGAGSDDATRGLTYESTLAEMSWPAFFNDEAGGSLIACLRSWAKSNYDVVLIDSRTGFADVAGICTMQMPDAVALCFVLNRQNIDGIAKVGSAIRREAGHVAVRAVPMRVAREETNEETDARARARAELIRLAKFTPGDVEQDFSGLAIKAALSVPFYERLAPFSVADTSKDVLTLDYVSLARNLLRIDVAVPVIDRAWLDEVRRRLKPTRATLAFMNELASAGPERVAEELDRLLDGAMSLESEGEELEMPYLGALIEAAMKFGRENPLADPAPGAAIARKGLDLARDLAASEPAKWRTPLIDLLERSHATSAYGDPDEEIAQLEEIDGLLALCPETPEILWRRSAHRRRIARLSLLAGSTDIGVVFTHDAEKLLDRLAETQEGAANVLFAQAENLLIRGEGLTRASPSSDVAAESFAAALAKLGEPREDDGAEVVRIRFELHRRLVRLLERRVPPDHEAAGVHVLNAAAAAPANLLLTPAFAELAQAACARPDHPEVALRFIELAFMAGSRPNGFSIGRSSRSLPTLTRSALMLCQALEGLADQKARHDAVEMVAAAVARVAAGERRPGYRLIPAAVRIGLAANLIALARIATEADASPDVVNALLAAEEHASVPDDQAPSQ